MLTNRRHLRPGLIAAAGLSLTLAATLVSPATASAAPKTGGYTEQDIAVNGEGGFPNYRIPALTVAPSGDVLASYDGRPTGIDAPGPNSILQRRSTDGGDTWGPQTVISAGDPTPPVQGYSDPSYITDRETGTLFNFHAYSQQVSFIGSQTGVDPENPNVLHAAVSTSTDDGKTWTRRIITAAITPDLSWRSRFAASGEGIQLRYGPNAGRLIQQYTIINGQGDFQAISIYSDDHGETWQAGEPVGTGMDENKTVELSDGRVMLNSRDSQRSGYRKVAISDDGGETYGPVTIDRELPDPANNASIIRAYPDAKEGSERAKVLLFSNAASTSSRQNGTVRMSCDDGQSWPVAKVFQPGSMSYSTLSVLPDGDIGLLYEPGNGIRFAQFDMEWLDGVCAPLLIEDVAVDRGTTTEVEIVIENQAGRALPKADVSLQLPEGWTGEVVSPRVIRPNRDTTVTARVTVPEGTRGGSYPVTAVLDTKRGSSQGTFTVDVNRLPGEVDGEIEVTGGTLSNPQTDGYEVGDVLRFTYRVTNLTSATTTVVPQGNLDNLDPANAARNCRYRNLPGDESYTCTTPSHTVTQADLDAGQFTPETTWTSTSGDDVSTVEVNGEQVDLS